METRAQASKHRDGGDDVMNLKIEALETKIDTRLAELLEEIKRLAAARASAPSQSQSQSSPHSAPSQSQKPPNSAPSQSQPQSKDDSQSWSFKSSESMAESRVEMLLNEDVMRNEAKSRRTTESLGLRTRKIRRRISWEEIEDRWFKGLCMFCDEQEAPGHHLNHKNAGMLFLDDGEVQLVDEEAVEIEDERSCDMFLVDENEKSSATSCELEQGT